MQENPHLDVVVVLIEGGRLIRGVGSAIKQINPKIKIFGINAQVTSNMFDSLKQDKPTKTITDGIAVRNIVSLNYELVKKVVDEW